MTSTVTPSGAEEFDPLDYQTIAVTVATALLNNPTVSLPPTTSFPGAGVYVVYYGGKFAAYAPISKTEVPIYVGKAIPKGSRRGLGEIRNTPSPALFNRLRDHAESIEAATNLRLSDFTCRYLVVTPIWIEVAEALLIARFRPVWNSVVDGFGLHDPGSTRYTQKKSEWDTLHPGRLWESKMQPGKSEDAIRAAIASHFAS